MSYEIRRSVKEYSQLWLTKRMSSCIGFWVPKEIWNFRHPTCTHAQGYTNGGNVSNPAFSGTARCDEQAAIQWRQLYIPEPWQWQAQCVSCCVSHPESYQLLQQPRFLDSINCSGTQWRREGLCVFWQYHCWQRHDGAPIRNLPQCLLWGRNNPDVRFSIFEKIPSKGDGAFQSRACSYSYLHRCSWNGRLCMKNLVY